MIIYTLIGLTCKILFSNTKIDKMWNILQNWDIQIHILYIYSIFTSWEGEIFHHFFQGLEPKSQKPKLLYF